MVCVQVQSLWCSECVCMWVCLYHGTRAGEAPGQGGAVTSVFAWFVHTLNRSEYTRGVPKDYHSEQEPRVLPRIVSYTHTVDALELGPGAFASNTAGAPTPHQTSPRPHRAPPQSPKPTSNSDTAITTVATDEFGTPGTPYTPNPYTPTLYTYPLHTYLHRAIRCLCSPGGSNHVPLKILCVRASIQCIFIHTKTPSGAPSLQQQR